MVLESNFFRIGIELPTRMSRYRYTKEKMGWNVGQVGGTNLRRQKVISLTRNIQCVPKNCVYFFLFVFRRLKLSLFRIKSHLLNCLLKLLHAFYFWWATSFAWNIFLGRDYLGCNTVWYCGWLSTFRTSVLPPCSSLGSVRTDMILKCQRCLFMFWFCTYRLK